MNYLINLILLFSLINKNKIYIYYKKKEHLKLLFEFFSSGVVKGSYKKINNKIVPTILPLIIGE